MRSILENGFGLPLGLYLYEYLKMAIFTFSQNFRVNKLEPFSGKEKQIFQSCLNQNIVLGTILDTGFEAPLR